MSIFSLNSKFIPQGDQKQAIEKLTKSLNSDNSHQTLLGVTGSGKTFSMANIISNISMPALVISHNKTLAAQLYSELRQFFPDNAVEYFVSYFDYYQPEAYIPRTDTYIEKDSSINDEVERLRLSAMSSLLRRRDVIIVASVSCIYGLGSPDDYQNMTCSIKVGDIIDRDDFIKSLVYIFYERNDIEFSRGKFRVKGDVVEVFPAYLENEAIRIEFFGDEIEQITAFNTNTLKSKSILEDYIFFPAKQFVTSRDKILSATKLIRQEMEERVDFFEKNNLLIEAQRIKQRTEYDIEMMLEIGFCQGIENYSRHINGKSKGETPNTLLDFFPKDNFFTIIDESHVGIPQIGAMYRGDQARKQNLIDFGFRLPSALDNRPLKFDEFMNVTGQKLYVSATPGKFELNNSFVGNNSYIPLDKSKTYNKTFKMSGYKNDIKSFKTNVQNTPLIVEQIIRPTNIVEPIIKVFPLKGQIDTTIELCQDKVNLKQRVLITTLTKRTAEDLTDYLKKVGLSVLYIHSDIGTVERVEILKNLRSGECDILVGINLLREGLDLPEVSLVCILDADKEGFLRSLTSLIQTVGRVARHVSGEAVLFADNITDSIKKLISISDYRREIQVSYNKKYNLEPKTTYRKTQESLNLNENNLKNEDKYKVNKLDKIDDIESLIDNLEKEMKEASEKLEFERALILYDKIINLKKIKK